METENRSAEVGVCFRFRRSLWHSNLNIGLYCFSQPAYSVASCTHCTCNSSAGRRLAFLLARSTPENRVCGLCCILRHSGSGPGVYRAPVDSIGIERPRSCWKPEGSNHPCLPHTAPENHGTDYRQS